MDDWGHHIYTPVSLETLRNPPCVVIRSSAIILAVLSVISITQASGQHIAKQSTWLHSFLNTGEPEDYSSEGQGR